MVFRLRHGWARVIVAGSLAAGAGPALAADIGAGPGSASACAERASAGCMVDFALPNGAGRMRYYQSALPAEAARSALVVMHGHPRDANRSFDAGLLAARRAGRLADTLVVAPVYQVPDDQDRPCRTAGVPAAQPGDAVWTCEGWLSGQPSLAPPSIGAFAALDALVADIARRWPGVRDVTLAGFSAGAQMLQHSAGFAADPPNGIALRYVISDPGSWLYFDPVRPRPRRSGEAVDWAACGTADFPRDCSFSFDPPPDAADCPGFDAWKYGVQSLPAALGVSAAKARARYAAAQIDVLEGALDSSAAKGTYHRILDKSCAAMLQGPFRLQRGVAYAAYEDAVLHPQHRRRLVIVPGCAHDVACVLPSPEARPVLFPPLR